MSGKIVLTRCEEAEQERDRERALADEALVLLDWLWRDWSKGKLPTSGPEMLTYQPMADAARLLNQTFARRMQSMRQTMPQPREEG